MANLARMDDGGVVLVLNATEADIAQEMFGQVEGDTLIRWWTSEVYKLFRNSRPVSPLPDAFHFRGLSGLKPAPITDLPTYEVGVIATAIHRMARRREEED